MTEAIIRALSEALQKEDEEVIYYEEITVPALPLPQSDLS